MGNEDESKIIRIFPEKEKGVIQPLPHECQSLVQGMFNFEAIKFGDFRWTYHNDYPNAPLAPMYFEIRMIRGDPLLRNYAVDVLTYAVDRLEFDLIADVPTSITPTVTMLAERLHVGMVSPRKEAKSMGSGNIVDGFFKKYRGMKTVLIDDVLARGDSKLVSARNLKREGAIVNDIVVLMDYEIGGRRILKENRYNVHSVFTVRQLLDYLRHSGKIRDGKYHRTLERLVGIKRYFEEVDNS